MSHFAITRSTAIAISLLLFISGCATKRTISKSLKSNDATKTTASEQQAEEFTTYYLIGNTGSNKAGVTNGIARLLGDKLSSAKEDDYLLFLGDNISSNDLSDARVTNQLDTLARIISDFKGESLVIPGEKEWRLRGLDGLEATEDYFEAALGKDDTFEPENGCPLETIEVDDQTEIIIVDSQWYIEDWDKRSMMNDKCEFKTRKQFIVELKDKIKKARHKNVLLVMHHPLLTNGIHGGRLPFSILYNPTRFNGYLPLIGTLGAWLRSEGGISKQDRYNPLMNELMSEIKTSALEVPRMFILSAHENSLQYIADGTIRQLISGTASSSEAASLGRNGLFSSGRPGFSELKLYKNGRSEVRFYTLEPEDNTVKIFEMKAFPEKEPYPIDSLSNDFPPTFKASVYPPEQVLVDEKFEERWGRHYRYAYGVAVEAPVAFLDTLYGGLTPERAGGGNQTVSLRLLDKAGRGYNLRALAKSPYSYLKSFGFNDLNAKAYFSETLPAELIADFYTAAHPYGAFVIADLAHQINLKHTHPQLFYVPKQRALGDFNKEHGNKLYMLERKPDGDFENFHMFGNSDEVIDTFELFEALRNDENNQVDEAEYIRARIFDMLVGDWDRHEGQWSWSKREEGEKNIYAPVPRDRDQVFANFDGKYLEFLQKFMSGTRVLAKYGPDIEFVKYFSESAINLDRAIIQRSGPEVWREQVLFIQKQLDKEAVSRAFASAPKEIQDEVWAKIQDHLLLRKKNLGDIVDRYLAYFLKFQTLKGTDKDDIFFIDHNNSDSLHISAFRIKDGEKGSKLFERSYTRNETNEIWVYGLDDKDVFNVSGSAKSNIKMVLAGGLEEDVYTIENGGGIAVYDQKSSKNEIQKSGGAKLRISDNYANHIYNPEVRPSSSNFMEPNMIFNPDEGVVPQLRIGKETMGLERNPFTSMWAVDIRYVSLTQAIEVIPELHFANIFGRWNFKIDGRLTSNNYTENFFGFGNSSSNQGQSFDANRILVQYLQGGLGVYRSGSYGHNFEFGIHYKSVSTEPTPLATLGNAADHLEFIDLGLRYGYKSLDNEEFPTRGMRTALEATMYDNLAAVPTTWALGAGLELWNALEPSGNLVLKNKFQGQWREGSMIPFYHSARLGGDSGLRAYRQHRFTGRTTFSTSADMRYKFRPIKTALFPVRLNTFVGYDLGSVWHPSSSSNRWYESYGGGLNISMASLVSLHTSYFKGSEGGRFTMGLYFGL